MLKISDVEEHSFMQLFIYTIIVSHGFQVVCVFQVLLILRTLQRDCLEDYNVTEHPEKC